MKDKDWFRLSPENLIGIKEATQTVHWAVQLLAYAAVAFAEKKEDDSHTSLKWDPEKRMFIGKELRSHGGVYLGLIPESLSLLVLDKEHRSIDRIELKGKSESEGVEELLKILKGYGYPVDLFQTDIHYTIPESSNTYYTIENSTAMLMVSVIRSLAHDILESYASRYEHASSVMTWPHHFDIASYIPLQFSDKREVIKSMSLGLAIPDEVIDDYYFYVTHWSKEGKIMYDQLGDLLAGGYWNQKDWVGAVLPLSSITVENDKSAQRQRVESFIDSAIQETVVLLSSG